jgi:hypothetical protein
VAGPLIPDKAARLRATSGHLADPRYSEARDEPRKKDRDEGKALV